MWCSSVPYFTFLASIVHWLLPYKGKLHIILGDRHIFIFNFTENAPCLVAYHDIKLIDASVSSTSALRSSAMLVIVMLRNYIHSVELFSSDMVLLLNFSPSVNQKVG